MPTGSVFIPTGIARLSGSGAEGIDLQFNGETVIRVSVQGIGANGTVHGGEDVVSVPPGLVAHAGPVVEIVDPGSPFSWEASQGDSFVLLGYTDDV